MDMRREAGLPSILLALLLSGNQRQGDLLSVQPRHFTYYVLLRT